MKHLSSQFNGTLTVIKSTQMSPKTRFFQFQCKMPISTAQIHNSNLITSRKPVFDPINDSPLTACTKPNANFSERNSHPRVLPYLPFITMISVEVDRLIGLELGADDYICKPFSPREVVARVKAVLRRTAAAQEPPAHQTTTAALMLDESHWQATLHGRPLGLTRREFKLLQVLARQTGRIFSRAQLLDQAYDDTLDVNERAIDSHIKNLRKKLKAASTDGSDWIRSVYGVGFALDPTAPD